MPESDHRTRTSSLIILNEVIPVIGFENSQHGFSQNTTYQIQCEQYAFCRRYTLPIEATLAYDGQHRHGLLSAVCENQFVTLESPLLALQKTSRSRTYLNTNLADMIKTLLNAEGSFSTPYLIDPALQKKVIRFARQHDQTDWDFLRDLCQQHALVYAYRHTQDSATLIFSENPSTYHNLVGDHHHLSYCEARGELSPDATIFSLQAFQDARTDTRLKVKTQSSRQQLGDKMTIDQHPEVDFNACYYVTAIKSISQRDNWPHPTTPWAATHFELILLPVTTHNDITPSPLNLTGPAKATLERVKDQHYYYRYQHEDMAHPYGKASPRAEKLEHAPGQGSGSRFSLSTTTDLLVDYYHETPFILGSFSQSQPMQYRLKTASGNTFEILDQSGSIACYTPKKMLGFSLEREKLSVYTKSPYNFTLSAHESIVVNTQANYKQRIKKHYTANITQHHKLTTQQGNIRFTIGKDHTLISKHHVDMTAEKDLTLQADGNFSVSSKNELTIRTAHGDLQIAVPQGDLMFENSGDLTLCGETLSLECGRSSLTISAQGDLCIQGQTVKFVGQQCLIRSPIIQVG